MEPPNPSPFPIFNYKFEDGVKGFVDVVIAIQRALKSLHSIGGLPAIRREVCPDQFLYVDVSPADKPLLLEMKLDDLYLSSYSNQFGIHEFSQGKTMKNVHKIGFSPSYTSMAGMAQGFQRQPQEERNGKEREEDNKFISSLLFGFHDLKEAFEILRGNYHSAQQVAKSLLLVTIGLIESIRSTTIFWFVIRSFTFIGLPQEPSPLGIENLVLIRSWGSNSLFFQIIIENPKNKLTADEDLKKLLNQTLEGLPLGFFESLLKVELGVVLLTDLKEQKENALKAAETAVEKARQRAAEKGRVHKANKATLSNPFSTRVEESVSCLVRNGNAAPILILERVKNILNTIDDHMLSDIRLLAEEQENQQKMPEKEKYNMMVFGQCKSGKSTTLDHFFLRNPEAKEYYDTKGDDEDSLLGWLRYAWEIGKEGPDLKLSTSKRDFVVVNAPGCSQFLPRMFSGLGRGDYALMIIDASPCFSRTETQNQARLAFLFGVKEMVCIINKMDATPIPYCKDRFKEIVDLVSSDLLKVGFLKDELCFVPISAKNGDNIFEKSDNLNWYKDLTLLDALNNLGEKLDNSPLRMKINSSIEFEEKINVVLVGIVLNGKLEVDTDVRISWSPSHYSHSTRPVVRRAKSIHVDENTAKSEVSFKDGNVFLKMGYIKDSKKIVFVSEKDRPVEHVVNFIALLLLLEAPAEGFGNKWDCCEVSLRLLELRDCIMPGNIRFLLRINPKTGMVHEENLDPLKMGDVVAVQINLNDPMVLEIFRTSSLLGRVVVKLENCEFEGIICSVEKKEKKEEANKELPGLISYEPVAAEGDEDMLGQLPQMPQADEEEEMQHQREAIQRLAQMRCADEEMPQHETRRKFKRRQFTIMRYADEEMPQHEEAIHHLETMVFDPTLVLLALVACNKKEGWRNADDACQ